MDKILAWIKANLKEGAKVAEVETLVKEIVELKSIDTKEKALELMGKDGVFKSALDSETSTRIENHDKTKLPELEKSIRVKIEAELNPDLTDDQKRIKVLETEAAANKSRDEVATVKAGLRTKATELKFDPVRAEGYHVYGDKALEMLEADSKYFADSITNGVNLEIKTRFGNTPPKQSVNTDPAKIMNRGDFEALGATAKSTFMQGGGTLTEE
jgi:hypothetical protein